MSLGLGVAHLRRTLVGRSITDEVPGHAAGEDDDHDPERGQPGAKGYRWPGHEHGGFEHVTGGDDLRKVALAGLAGRLDVRLGHDQPTEVPPAPRQLGRQPVDGPEQAISAAGHGGGDRPSPVNAPPRLRQAEKVRETNSRGGTRRASGGSRVAALVDEPPANARAARM